MGSRESWVPKPEDLAEMHKERKLTDAELIKGGAEVTEEGQTLATEDQIKDAKVEMGEDFHERYQREKRDREWYEQQAKTERELRAEKFNAEKEVNGIRISAKWIGDKYILFVSKGAEKPRAERDFEDSLDLSAKNDDAIDIFNYAIKMAEMKNYGPHLFQEIRQYAKERGIEVPKSLLYKER